MILLILQVLHGRSITGIPLLPRYIVIDYLGPCRTLNPHRKIYTQAQPKSSSIWYGTLQVSGFLVSKRLEHLFFWEGGWCLQRLGFRV